ncbi:amidohydrolase family protein [Rhizobium sp. S152]|uniref:amidohydrolase family protein n=1 Tax=Rhizobium sp. S152 TaxID=3055038 RepID=UPI0025A9A501|nr:amidohydrolase family protein [Rhizobium sp. S152]MDM9628015.1 amidohydrolase family protein [Rhizobium sp. S152]
MEIIDSQIHVWEAASTERPWPNGLISLQGDPFSIDQALATMDSSNVDRAVLVAPSWVGNDNYYVLEAACRHPNRFAVMGRIDLDADQSEETLTSILSSQGVLGIRLLLNSDVTRNYVFDRNYDWFWDRCQADDVPVMLFVPAGADIIEPLASKYPLLKIIVDHAGRNPRSPKDEAAWHDLDALLALAEFDNVAVKVSSLPAFSTGPYPYEVLHEPIRAIHNTFGANRMMWGSDVTRLVHPYLDNVRLFIEALDFLSPSDLDQIMGKSLRQWCGWD